MQSSDVFLVVREDTNQGGGKIIAASASRDTAEKYGGEKNLVNLGVLVYWWLKKN